MRPRAPVRASAWVVAIAVFAGLPQVLPVYHQFVLSLTLVNAIAAMGVNLSMGYAGQVSIGHAGFVAIGAYTAAILMIKTAAPYWLTLPLGGMLAALFGFLIGLPALRLSHLYIGMVTFGFGQAISFIALNWVALTNGPNGLTMPAITLGSFAFSPDSFYYVIAGVFLVLLWVARNLVASRIGRSFRAIRESETAAEAMGVNLVHYKTMAFAVGAAYAGLAGGLYAGLSQFVNPDAFVFLVSVLYLTMNVVGGMGTLAGPLVGAVIFTLTPELLRTFAEYKELLSGALLLAFLVFFPRGLVGILEQALSRRVRWLGKPARLTASSVGDDA